MEKSPLSSQNRQKNHHLASETSSMSGASAATFNEFLVGQGSSSHWMWEISGSNGSKKRKKYVVYPINGYNYGFFCGYKMSNES